jgi:hypothetical protein
MAVVGVGTVCILTCISVLQPPPSFAQSTNAGAIKTYHNNKTHYSISYPSSWKVMKSPSDDLQVRSKDGQAFIAADSVVGTATAAQIKARQAQVLRGLGKPAGKLSYTVRPINGVVFQISELVVKSPKGSLVDTIALDTVRRGHLFDFGAGILLNQKNSKKEVDAVLASLFSIKIA